MIRTPNPRFATSRRRALRPGRLSWAASLAGALLVVAPGVDAAEPLAPDAAVATESPTALTTEETLVPMAPERFVDTRENSQTVDGDYAGAGRQAGDSVYPVQIAGRGSVPKDAVGAVMNITAIRPEALGFLTAYDCTAARPLASTLNYTELVTVGNEVVADLSTKGEVCLYTDQEVDLTVDVVAYLPPTTDITSITPNRYLETRPGEETFDGASQGSGRTAPGTTTKFQVAGRGDVPADAEAIVANVTAVNPLAPGFVQVHACLDPVPVFSSLNYVPGVNRGNELFIDLDATGAVCIDTSTDIHLTVDVVGFVPVGTNVEHVPQARLADTRGIAETVDDQFEGEGRRTAGSTYKIDVAGRGGIPADARAAILNLAAIQPDDIGYFTVHPCVDPTPNAASLNVTPGVTGANELIVQLDPMGAVCVYSSTGAHLALDAVGYLANAVAMADLSIAASDSPDPVVAGTSLTYTYTVTNDGPNDATGVTVTGTLPAGVTLASTTGCAEDPSGVPACTLGTIASGDTGQFSVVVDVDAAGSGDIVNEATVTSTTFDPDLSNNTTSETTTIDALGTIIIEKTTTPTGGTGFGFTDDIAVPNAFTLDDGGTQTFTDVAPGTYTVTEDDPAPSTPTGIVCDDGASATPSTGDVGTRTATIGLDPGETVTCTFGNNINRAPDLGVADPAIDVDENQTAAIDLDATDDFDAEGAGLTYSFTGGADQASFTIDAATGVVTFLAAPDFESPADDNGDGTYEVQVTVTDSGPGALLTDTADLALTVADVNEDPTITSDGGGDTALRSVVENETAVTDVESTDPDGDTEGAGLTYSITGGADGGEFDIVAATGVLTFDSPPDFENPTDANGDNEYEVTVTVTDSGGLTDDQDIDVRVTEVNEAPIITSDGGGSKASLSAAENQTAVTDVEATDDNDSEGSGLLYSIVGGADQALFDIDVSTGVLTFLVAPDFENPTDSGANNIYNVRVRATDSGSLFDTQIIKVWVTDVDESP